MISQYYSKFSKCMKYLHLLDEVLEDLFLFLFPHMRDFPPLTAVFKFTEIVENDNQVQQKQKYIA